MGERRGEGRNPQVGPWLSESRVAKELYENWHNGIKYKSMEEEEGKAINCQLCKNTDVFSILIRRL